MLPGLTPAHTRSSYYGARSVESSGSRLHIESIVESPDDFLLADGTGLWLLPPRVAEKDAEQDIARADWMAKVVAESGASQSIIRGYQKFSSILGRSSISSIGCVVGGLRGNQTPPETAIQLAEFEMRVPCNNTPEEVEHISLCGDDDCYNSRHHNIDFGASRIDMQRVELNPSWFSTRDDGMIETVWGDVLSSVDSSLRYFMEFQQSQFPFVAYADSPLTPTPISQLSFHPLTGCWESYLYEKNMPGLSNAKNGYGIMYARQAPDVVDTDTGEITKGYRRGSYLAHNLIWAATGRELVKEMDRNHLCNYTRCCNPLHIEQITPVENRKHGQAARRTIRALEKDNPGNKDAALSRAKVAAMYVPLRKRYAEIELDIAPQSAP